MYSKIFFCEKLYHKIDYTCRYGISLWQVAFCHTGPRRKHDHKWLAAVFFNLIYQMNSYFPYFEFLKRFLLLIACIVVDVVIVLWSSRDNDVVFIGTTRGPAPGRPGGSNTSKRRRRQGSSECCFLFSCAISQWSLWHIWKLVVKVICTSNWLQENLHKCRIMRLKVETWKLQFKMVESVVHYCTLNEI